MTKKLQNDYNEIVVSDSKSSLEISRAVKSGRLRKIASKLYTSNLDDPIELIVKNNLWQIVGKFFPGAVITDRTAFENKPTSDGAIYIISNKGREIHLPGITIKPRHGIKNLKSDKSFIEGLYLSSTARAFLENLKESRSINNALPRTLTRDEIENRLDSILRQGGETALNRLREDVNKIAPELNMEEEAAGFNEIVGSLLGTKEHELVSNIGKARKSGMAYDPKRLKLFESLITELRNISYVSRNEKVSSDDGNISKAFFESYFSNFIEGTEFEVSEAEEIIFDNIVPKTRPEDAHDIIGTWKIVSSKQEMKKLPKDFDDFLDLLKQRHASIMEARLNKRPGEFKVKGNRAGSTSFVEPELVIGTLKIGYELYLSLETALQRAIFMMFLISEVHPFVDGNGRTARIMMNAELVAKNEERIIIPTIYRNNYLSALKTLSHNGSAEPLVRTLDFAQKWVSLIEWGSLAESELQIKNTNGFIDSSIAELDGIRLRLP